jgi:hypothetical protein
MAVNTYVELDKVTLASAAASATFTSIPQGYTDLILVCNVGSESTNAFTYLQFNGDTGTNYSFSQLYGTGAGAFNSRVANTNQLFNSDVSMKQGAVNTNVIYQIMNYSNSSTFKTSLSRQNTVNAADYNGALAAVGIWRSTAAITSIAVKATRGGTPYNFTAGSTFSLYGIKAWAPEATPKATGGYVTSDSTYWYHSFPFSSTFTPNQSLTCDYLIVAGGGGGGSVANIGNGGRGGGGAGGLLVGSAALTATTYTVTVGAGGAGGPGGTESDGVSGTNSQFNSLTATGGGFGSKSNTNGGNGGSGGGAGAWDTATLAGTGTAGQGNSGGVGTGGAGSQTYSGGGGGGAGGAGTAAGSLTVGGNGGLGYSSSIIGSSQFYAGGGAGGNYQDQRIPTGGSGVGGNGKSFYIPTPPGNGVPSTGGGGGGGAGGHAGTFYGGSGGSGVVIVRYVKA